jgi:DNA-binding NarL/FixJ family response regulator
MADLADVEVAGEAASGEETVRLSAVVMGICMPGRDGIEATRHITSTDSHTRVIVLTTFDDDAYVYGALIAPSVTRRLIPTSRRDPKRHACAAG